MTPEDKQFFKELLAIEHDIFKECLENYPSRNNSWSS